MFPTFCPCSLMFLPHCMTCLHIVEVTVELFLTPLCLGPSPLSTSEGSISICQVNCNPNEISLSCGQSQFHLSRKDPTSKNKIENLFKSLLNSLEEGCQRVNYTTCHTLRSPEYSLCPPFSLSSHGSTFTAKPLLFSPTPVCTGFSLILVQNPSSLWINLLYVF